MKLIGYREANFRPDNGKGEEVKGYMIYLGNEIDPRRGSGIQKQKSTPAAYLMLTIQKVKSVTRRLTISSRYLPGCPLRSCSGCRKKSKHKCSNA